MKIVEIFNSIEGEGIRAGFLTTFIRMYGCNLNCSYCDSRYACDDENYTEMSIEDILNAVLNYGNQRITLTGGEPLLTSDGWRLAELLALKGYEVNIETNGSIALPKTKHKNIFYTMDYKCPSSGMEDKMVMSNFHTLVSTTLPNRHNVLKFVVGDSKDLHVMRTLLDDFVYNNSKCHISDLNVDVYVSPIFGKIEPQQIVEYMKGFNLQNIRLQIQLHKFVWAPEMRGV